LAFLLLKWAHLLPVGKVVDTHSFPYDCVDKITMMPLNTGSKDFVRYQQQGPLNIVGNRLIKEP